MGGDVVRVGVLMGGTSAEREVSVASGRSVLRNLNPDRYDAVPIVIEASGTWVLPRTASSSRRKRGAESAASILQRSGFDAVFVALHGPGGEDGTVQGLLEYAGIPYTGSGVLASALAMHKARAKPVLEHAGLRTPAACSIPLCWSAATMKERVKAFAARAEYAVVVKPADNGSSFGVSIVHREEDIASALELAGEHGTEILVEKHIAGKEVSCGVVGNSEDGHAEPLPVTEIVPRAEFFDFRNKYTPGAASEYTPARLDDAATLAIQDAAVRAHLALGCDGLSRVDMILAGAEVFVLEVNTIPGMTETSLCPQQAAAAGLGFAGLLDRMVELALSRKATRRRATRTGTADAYG